MNSTSMTQTIGLDLGDRTSQVCVLDKTGKKVEEGPIRTRRRQLHAFFRKCERARVILEVGTHSPWISELIAELGHEVIVANPRRLKLISEGHRKSDRIDAEFLARLGRVDPELVAPITHRSRQARQDLMLIRTRHELVQTRTKLINHVRGLVKPLGQRLPSCKSKVFHDRARDGLEQTLLDLLGPTLAVIESVSAQISAVDQAIDEMAARHPDVEVLQQVFGVGALTAMTFILTLENNHRFKKSRDVGAYLGLTPRRSQSGGRDPEMRISKHGDKYLRWLMVQCAHQILRETAPDSDLRRWGSSLAARGKRNAKKRAVVAVARRLAVLLHRLWVTGEVYQALGYARSQLKAA